MISLFWFPSDDWFDGGVGFGSDAVADAVEDDGGDEVHADWRFDCFEGDEYDHADEGYEGYEGFRGVRELHIRPDGIRKYALTL